MRQFFFLALLVSILYFISSCEHDPVLGTGGPIISDLCDEDTVYFVNDIVPIFVTTCSFPGGGCHDDIFSGEDGKQLTEIHKYLEKKITDADPKKTKLYERLVEDDPDLLMPKDPITKVGYELPKEQLDLIVAWLEQGGLNNFCNACDENNFTFSGAVNAIIEKNCGNTVSCHGSGSTNGDYTSYAGIKSKVDNGSFEQRVLTIGNMPPALPLQDCEMTILRKWLDDGALNN
ncbi:hypothetical protein QQ008_08395 [Fulvivirgaceae bacterium BMA10]|uniref:Cytochrome c domain-containing protein n=1 Tax=Splendidivirga corallicola TaxID=3051826 RepID=A0ABT8KNU0_9BACT|nr:hypothetical protein [Fulvivirgaceae bacterium BMA10]